MSFIDHTALFPQKEAPSFDVKAVFPQLLSKQGKRNKDLCLTEGKYLPSFRRREWLEARMGSKETRKGSEKTGDLIWARPCLLQTTKRASRVVTTGRTEPVCVSSHRHYMPQSRATHKTILSAETSTLISLSPAEQSLPKGVVPHLQVDDRHSLLVAPRAHGLVARLGPEGAHAERVREEVGVDHEVVEDDGHERHVRPEGDALREDLLELPTVGGRGRLHPVLGDGHDGPCGEEKLRVRAEGTGALVVKRGGLSKRLAEKSLEV